MEYPLFSIITVTFNAEKTVERTLRSVEAQTFKNFEHIIIDGASTDSTINIIASVPSTGLRSVFSEPDKGLYDAMNKGVGKALGKYLIFLNSGDKFHDDSTLSEIAGCIANNGLPDIVYGQTDLVDDNGRFVAPRHLSAPPSLSLKDFSKGMVVCHQAFVVKRDFAPYFSLKYRYSADYEWCIICLMHSKKNVYIDRVLIDYLVEGLSTVHRKESLMERFKIMSKYYGFWPTLFRHFSFIPRFFKHKRAIKKK